jgi:hypothetical protein
MPDQSSRTPEHAAVLAWWDPKRRKIVFDPTTILCGVLVAGRPGVVFASTRGIEFDIPADQLTVTWMKLGYGCHLNTPTATYRVFLAPPADGAPQLSHSAVDDIAETLTTARDLGDLADLAWDLGDLADALGIAGALGDAINIVSSISALRQAKRSREALQRQFAHTA